MQKVTLNTPDGACIELIRLKPNLCQNDRTPCILVHGLANNASIFAKMQSFLSERGWDTWCINLRTGRQRVPHGLQPHLQQDLQTAITHILEATGSQSIHYVGFSMGATLGYMLASSDMRDRIQSLTALAGGVHYQHSKYSSMLFLLRPLKLLGYVPLKSAARKYSRILCDVHFVVNSRNVERSLVLKLLRDGFEDGALQDVDDMIEFMKRRPSTRVQSLRQAVSTIRIPVFAGMGSADVQCPAVDALESAQLLPGPLTICQLGKSFGCEEDYGHFDCLLGTRAETELFVPLDEWLRTHASAASAKGV